MYPVAVSTNLMVITIFQHFKYLFRGDNLQYFELLCLLKSALFDVLQAGVGQGESGQVGDVGEHSAVQSGDLNTGHQMMLCIYYEK